MKRIAIEEDFYGNNNVDRKKTTKEMRRLLEIPPRLYFMPEIEVRNLENRPSFEYKELNFNVINPIVDGEHLIEKLLPKDDRPFYYNVANTNDINNKPHLADFVFSKKNGNPFVKPKVYNFDFFFSQNGGDVYFTTGIYDVYEEVYRIMTNFDFYVNAIFFKICDYKTMLINVKEYLNTCGITLDELSLETVSYNLKSKGFPYVVSLYNKVENYKKKKCQMNEVVQLDQFAYDDALVENFRDLIMHSSTVTWFGSNLSDPEDKAEYSEGQIRSNMYKKIFERGENTLIFDYTDRKSFDVLRSGMYSTILVRVPKSDLDFIVRVFAARNKICYDLSLITDVLKSTFLLTESGNGIYFDSLLANDHLTIGDRGERLLYNELLKKYTNGINYLKSDLWEVRKVYEDAIYINDYTLSSADNKCVVVKRDSIKNVIYISNEGFTDSNQIDYDGMEQDQEQIIENDENGQEVASDQKKGNKLNKLNDITGRSLIFSIRCAGVPFSIILNNCSSVRDISKSCINISFENVIICYNRWVIPIPNFENDSSPYYKAKFIYSYKDDLKAGIIKSFVKLEINPGDSLKEIPDIDPISKGLNDLFQTVIIIPADLFGESVISILPVERVENSFLVKRDSFVLTYKFNKKFEPCMIRLEQIEKDNKLIYDMNEKNDLNEDQLNDLKVLNVDEILMEGDPIDSEQLDWVFGDIGRNNENIIETKMDEDVREEEEVVDDFGSILLASAKKKKEESKPKKVVEVKKSDVVKKLRKDKEDEIKKD